MPYPHASHGSISYVLLGFMIAGGCRTMSPAARHVAQMHGVIGCAPASCGGADSQVEVTYLGVSGLLVRYDGGALMTAPFFSNPSVEKVALSTVRIPGRRGYSIRPDTALIDRFLPRSADAASAILVGHGHYDHLMDVAHIANSRAKAATIYGGPTVRHMLMGDSGLATRGGSRVVAIRARQSGTINRIGDWTYTSDGNFRFMALIANHGPMLRQFGLDYHFAGGRLFSDMAEMPRSAWDWKLGEPYAFLIDVLARGDSTPRFRIYYQDAPSSPPWGFPPRAVLDERGVDLAIICAATTTYVGGAPDQLIRHIAPRHVMVTHWESFFRRGTLGVHSGQAANLDKFTKLLERSLPANASWAMPAPQTAYRFRAAFSGKRN